MNTMKAITALLYDEEWLLAWLRAGHTNLERRNYRRRLKDGKLSIELQEKLLQEVGFSVKQEKLWNKPVAA